MNWADWVILTIIGLSTLLSLWRGFVKEALSLVAWVAAFFVAIIFSSRLAALLAGFIAHDGLRSAAAYVILFLATLVLVALLNHLMAQLIKMTGLSGLDRLLGTVFGFARGALFIVVVVYVARLVVPEPDALEQSLLLPQVMLVVQWAEANFSTLVTGIVLPWQQ